MHRFVTNQAKTLWFLLAAAMLVGVSLPWAQTRSVAASVSSLRASAVQVVSNEPADRRHLIFLRQGVIDTRQPAIWSPEYSAALNGEVTPQSQATQKTLCLIQFRDAVERRWLDRLQATGVEIVGYVPNNAFVIRGNLADLARVASLATLTRPARDNRAADETDERPIQWMSRLMAMEKIAPELDEARLSLEQAPVAVQIQLLDTPDAAADIAYIRSVAIAGEDLPQEERLRQRKVAGYLVVAAQLPIDTLERVADLNSVLFIEPQFAPTLQDERSAQIIAGNTTADGALPMGAGYREWLAAKGLNTPADYIIDFGDSGIDRGSIADMLVHPDLRDAQGQSRVAYIKNYAVGTTDRRGHGTLVASIAAGLGAAARLDEANYLYGLGVDPQAKVGASRIFSDNGSQPTFLSYSEVVAAAYAAGARLSNNSWGNRSNVYDLVAQEYDALVRDAQPGVLGNQEMVMVFSCGNGGAGGAISSPGTAKNVLTVAASENYRPEGTDACNLDGNGGVGPDGADNALDMLRFSSGGPTADGRAKPDITAPGTHIYGAASQASGFFADGLCPGAPIFRPSVYSPYFTWSSGTSLAAPHVTGAASLLRRYVTQNGLLAGKAPSPAMTKAWLINSASYLTGEGAGGTLPHERQGYGLVNLNRALTTENRRLLDQTELFTASGQVYEIRGALADRAAPLRVTLAWTDAPGMLIGAALVNNLDLEVRIGNTTIYRGNRFAGEFSVAQEAGAEADALNNVEAIIIPPEAIPAGAAGNFTILVRAVNIVGDGVPGNGFDFDQDFALVVANLTTPHAEEEEPPPPPVAPVISNVTYVKKLLTISGRDFTAAARVEINGKLLETPFTFDASTNSLSIKLKAKKLKLVSGAPNQIILIENNRRSQPFVIIV